MRRYFGLCRAKLYTCARLAKNPQSVSPSKSVFRLHDRCFYAEMTVRRSAASSQQYRLAQQSQRVIFAAFSQFRPQSTAWPNRAFCSFEHLFTTNVTYWNAPVKGFVRLLRAKFSTAIFFFWRGTAPPGSSQVVMADLIRHLALSSATPSSG